MLIKIVDNDGLFIVVVNLLLYVCFVDCWFYRF